VTALDVLLLMAVSGRRFYVLEITVAFFAFVILVCFAVELALVKADPAAVMLGFLPSTALVTNADSMLIAIGILGATVMPHNLYLHSSLVILKKSGGGAGGSNEEEEQSLLSLNSSKMTNVSPMTPSRDINVLRNEENVNGNIKQDGPGSPAQQVEAAAKAARADVEGTGITDSTASDVATTAAIDAVVRLDQQSDGTVSPGTVIVSQASTETAESETMDSVRAATIDTIRCLILALFVNAAILITAAGAFHTSGHEDVASLEDASEILANVLPNGRAASIIFGIALLASGQSSTITGTIAGQVVMEGFLQIKVAPNLRRILTRLVAIIPAAIAAGVGGDSGINMLLIVSQVILSFQLPFAVIPLLHIVSDEQAMGKFTIRGFRLYLGWAIALLIISLNCWLVVKQFID
jgi:Mn2+/Fe2+ NRAMP family transporter